MDVSTKCSVTVFFLALLIAPPGVIRLEQHTVPGKSYQLMRSEDLLSWSPVGPAVRGDWAYIRTYATETNSTRRRRDAENRLLLGKRQCRLQDVDGCLAPANKRTRRTPAPAGEPASKEMEAVQ